MSRKKRGQPIHGWLVLDKPGGLTSAQAVDRCKRALDAAKAGHGGTLDPMATGVLPVAFGEATKTMRFAMDGIKRYRFTVRWGESRDTDDAAGEVTGTNPHRPSREEIEAILPRFTGTIKQVPPAYSAIKLGGERAYDLARAGETPDLAPRPVTIDALSLVEMPDSDHASFEAVCGKGTYMRGLARDIALELGTLGHVSALRRLQVGPFSLKDAILLEDLPALPDKAAAERFLLPTDKALDDIPAVVLNQEEAHRLRCGQTVSIFRRSDRERLESLLALSDARTSGTSEGNGGTDAEPVALATDGSRPVALVRVDGATLHPMRVLNL